MRAWASIAVLLLGVGPSGFGRDVQPHSLVPVPIQQVAVDDPFWSPKLKLWREVTLPDGLAKFEKDGALTTFDNVRAGTGGRHAGPRGLTA